MNKGRGASLAHLPKPALGRLKSLLPSLDESLIAFAQGGVGGLLRGLANKVPGLEFEPSFKDKLNAALGSVAGTGTAGASLRSLGGAGSARGLESIASGAGSSASVKQVWCIVGLSLSMS